MCIACDGRGDEGYARGGDGGKGCGDGLFYGSGKVRVGGLAVAGLKRLLVLKWEVVGDRKLGDGCGRAGTGAADTGRQVRSGRALREGIGK